MRCQPCHEDMIDEGNGCWKCPSCGIEIEEKRDADDKRGDTDDTVVLRGFDLD